MQESSMLAKASGRYATVEIPEDLTLETNLGNYENASDEIPTTSSRYCTWQRKGLPLLTLGLSVCVLVLSVYIHTQQKAIQALTAKSHSSAAASNNISNSSTSTSSNNNNTLQWLPLPSSETIITKIAFGSCARQDMPQPYWDTLNTFQPQLVLLMGDNIYGDCDDETCTKLFRAYDDFGNHPSVQGAARQFPVFPVLDDHDYGQGDCHADNPYKEIARRKFASFYNIDWKDLPENDGVYRSRTFGPLGQRLQIILLDTRYSRCNKVKV
jgi:hypothetical protein